MPRYIDAEKLYELARNHIDRTVDCNDIMRFPLADVQEVKHGKWTVQHEGAYKRAKCYCSVCGNPNGIKGMVSSQKKPYCPNCGAKMDGKE